jgi:hypothetical protein
MLNFMRVASYPFTDLGKLDPWDTGNVRRFLTHHDELVLIVHQRALGDVVSNLMAYFRYHSFHDRFYILLAA